ncbi:MAG: hypothetical protein GY816_02370, partial [Cytophagales bacterium]|nr:hypothetical protein [Cytophagales bacterium]
FTFGDWVSEVPYDERFYFTGDEDSSLIRSYTSGWDVFVPPRNVVYHDYNDNRLQSPTKKRPLHWEDHDSTEPNLHLLGELQAGVGIGVERSMVDFEKHFGVDFKTKKIKELAKQGFTFDSQKVRVENREFCVVLDSDAIPDGSYKLWVFCLFDRDGNEVFRKDICDPEIISKQQKTLRISLTMEDSRMDIVKALIWPMIEDGVFGERHEYKVELKVIDTVTTPIATKIIILSQMTKDPSYQEIQNFSLRTWMNHNNPNVKIINYYGAFDCNGNIFQEFNKEIRKGQAEFINENTLVIGTYDKLNNSYFDPRGEKFIIALEYCLKNLEFDFIFRISSTNYIDIQKLSKHLDSLPRQKVYNGCRNMYDHKYKFVSGFHCIMSRDVVEKLVEYKDEYLSLKYPEDLAAGMILIHKLNYVNFEEQDEFVTHKNLGGPGWEQIENLYENSSEINNAPFYNYRLTYYNNPERLHKVLQLHYLVSKKTINEATKKGFAFGAYQADAEEGMECGILHARGNASSNLPMKPPDQNTQHPSQTIFVFIASYCDPELPRTLDDCLQNARHPKNLRFGICWQYDRQQPVNIQKFKHDARFQFVEYPIEQSQGGTWARSKAQQFWKGEPYTLQIDSHMKFERDWDVKLIQMMKKFPSDKPLITANSPVFWYNEQGKLHRETHRGVPTHKIVDWNPQLGWTIWADYGKPNTQWPGRTRILTGNFVFTLGQWNQEVPQDPEHYYHGEEWSLTIRSFTHGYDLFLPEEIVVWHRNELPRRHWEHGQDVVNRKNEIAFERLRMLIYSDDKEEHKKLGKYSLGTVRTIRDYEIYAGMDLKNKKAHPDVFEGNNPDPVTIKSEKDWEQCLTFEEFKTLICHSGMGSEK